MKPDSTSTRSVKARRWLRQQLTEDAMRSLEQAWTEFDQHDTPVITFLGSYDTGKSALLRRLLVDTGETSPPWLTISARHETFEANEAAVLECTVRDTPGLVLETGSDRATAHNAASDEAVRLTDALLLVFTPQGATAERTRIHEIIAQGWTSESLACTLNRFDEAGADALDDPEGFADLASRKTVELRTSLSLPAAVQVFITSPDPYQQNGAIAQPQKNSWDEFRAWDGIDSVVEWIRDIASQGPVLRQEASDRYWRGALGEAAANLDRAIEMQRSMVDEGAAAGERLGLNDQRIGALDRAARAALLGAIQEVALSGDRRGNVEDEWFSKSLQTACETWWDTFTEELNDLNSELHHEFAAQSRRPALIQLGFPAAEGSSTRPVPFDRTAADQYADMALRAWRVVVAEKQAVAATTRKPIRKGRNKDRQSALFDGRALAAAEGLKPLVLEFMDLVNERASDTERARQAQRHREQLRVHVNKATEAAAETFRAEWDVLVAQQLQDARDAWGPLSEQTAEAARELAIWEDRQRQARLLLDDWSQTAADSSLAADGRNET